MQNLLYKQKELFFITYSIQLGNKIQKILQEKYRQDQVIFR